MDRPATAKRRDQGTGTTFRRSPRRLRPWRAVCLAAALLVAVAACTPDDEGGQQPSATSDSAGAASAAVVVAVASTELGEVLVDGAGMTLYVFDADADHSGSACVDACVQVWPPLLAEATPVSAGDRVDPSLLGTIERDDGALQVTYGGWPLYGWAGDGQPGEVSGQGVDDAWWVVTPSADVLREASDAANSEEEDGARPGYGSYGSMNGRDDGY